METTCSICCNGKGKYTCPRCGIRYCSATCYSSQVHSNCAERFFKECVLDDLKHTEMPDQEKKRMIEILMRQQTEAALTEEDELAAERGQDLARRLQGVDLDAGDSQELWLRLTEEERQDFLHMVHENKLSAIVEPWIPWWMHQRTKPLVEEIGLASAPRQQSFDDDEDVSQLPAMTKSLQPFTAISKKPPPDCLKFNLVNILYSYVYVLQRYNGDHHSLPVSCLEDIVSLSDVLLTGENCLAPCDAIQKAMVRLQQLKDLCESPEYCTSLIDDVIMLIGGPEPREHTVEFVLLALSDTITLVGEARAEMDKDGDKQDDKKKLFLLKKKLDFYISWTLSFGKELHSLIPQLVQMAGNVLSAQEKKDSVCKAAKPAPKREKLIEEL